ncbi:hypothetical protein N0V84_007210 [Fusarium piperis]|uniref:Uncharacterized protein n=1 Tax=Fusarium piperis TaxID=1435070 RepID=A0A9W8WAE7_9HYPO|nr:hypothetical protein N0V84_007210 [Fusarium piperis]
MSRSFVGAFTVLSSCANDHNRGEATPSTTISACTATETPSSSRTATLTVPPRALSTGASHRSYIGISGLSNDGSYSLGFGSGSFTEEYVYQEIDAGCLIPDQEYELSGRVGFNKASPFSESGCRDGDWHALLGRTVSLRD